MTSSLIASGNIYHLLSTKVGTASGNTAHPSYLGEYMANGARVIGSSLTFLQKFTMANRCLPLTIALAISYTT